MLVAALAGTPSSAENSSLGTSRVQRDGIQNRGWATIPAFVLYLAKLVPPLPSRTRHGFRCGQPTISLVIRVVFLSDAADGRSVTHDMTRLGTATAPLGRSFWTHACSRQQSTDQSENRCSRFVFLASSSTIFASISAVSENARENPLVRVRR
jgi:hypothetical protein